MHFEFVLNCFKIQNKFSIVDQVEIKMHPYVSVLLLFECFSNVLLIGSGVDVKFINYSYDYSHLCNDVYQ